MVDAQTFLEDFPNMSLRQACFIKLFSSGRKQNFWFCDYSSHMLDYLDFLIIRWIDRILLRYSSVKNDA
jgi:hypothetical protein